LQIVALLHRIFVAAMNQNWKMASPAISLVQRYKACRALLSVDMYGILGHFL